MFLTCFCVASKWRNAERADVPAPWAGLFSRIDSHRGADSRVCPPVSRLPVRKGSARIKDGPTCLVSLPERMWCPAYNMADYSHILFNKSPSQLRLPGWRGGKAYGATNARAAPKSHLRATDLKGRASGMPFAARCVITRLPRIYGITCGLRCAAPSISMRLLAGQTGDSGALSPPESPLLRWPLTRFSRMRAINANS